MGDEQQRVRDDLHQIVDIYCRAGRADCIPAVIDLYLASGDADAEVLQVSGASE